MKVAETYDLTVMQALTLCLMEDKTPMPMNGLSHALHCDASNVTSVVDRLVTLGYIERKESAQDRRVKTIRLSLKGVRVRRQIMKKTAVSELFRTAVLSVEEQETLKQLLVKTLACEFYVLNKK